MNLRRDDRGQAIQVGAVLLFAMLIVAMSVYQAQVVPRENSEIEFNSYLEASSDMTTLRNDILGVASSNAQRGTTVTTGTTYPARVFFVNPGPATGRIQTGQRENLSLSNVMSPSDERNVDLFLQSETSTLEYTTRDVEFAPSYNEIDDQTAPVVVSNGFTYRNYSSPVALTTQTMIKGNRLTFVTVGGDLDAGGVDTSLTVNPVSAHTRTVTVTNRTSAPLNITVPTPIPNSTWEDEILAGQLDPSGTNPDRYVTSVDPGPRPNTVNVTLEAGETYELRVGRIELHEKSDVSSAESPEARYLTAETDRNVTTTRGRVKLTVEARDEYNNPVSNAVVNFTGEGADFETQDREDLEMPVRTDENGQATVWYNATGIVGNIPVTAYLNSTEPAAAEKKVGFRVTNTFTGTDGGGGAEDTNINPGNFMVLESAQKIDVGSTPDRYRVNTTLENQGDTPANVTAMRFSFYFEDDNNQHIVNSTVYDSSGTELLDLPIRGTFEDVSEITIPANGGTVSFQFAFDYEADNNAGDYDPNHQTDFFIIEVVYNDASTATYFVNFERIE